MNDSKYSTETDDCKPACPCKASDAREAVGRSGGSAMSKLKCDHKNRPHELLDVGKTSNRVRCRSCGDRYWVLRGSEHEKQIGWP